MSSLIEDFCHLWSLHLCI